MICYLVLGVRGFKVARVKLGLSQHKNRIVGSSMKIELIKSAMIYLINLLVATSQGGWGLAEWGGCPCQGGVSWVKRTPESGRVAKRVYERTELAQFVQQRFSGPEVKKSNINRSYKRERERERERETGGRGELRRKKENGEGRKEIYDFLREV